MEDKELENYLIEFTLEFGSKMNKLENKIVELDEKNPNQDYFDEFKENYLPIFKEYCTDKKRIYGGKGDAFGIPTRYDGIEKSVEKKTTVKNKNRVEVYFKTNNNFKAEYLFVVLKKNAVWKIDSVKYKWFEGEKWESQIL